MKSKSTVVGSFSAEGRTHDDQKVKGVFKQPRVFPLNNRLMGDNKTELFASILPRWEMCAA